MFYTFGNLHGQRIVGVALQPEEPSGAALGAVGERKTDACETRGAECV